MNYPSLPTALAGSFAMVVGLLIATALLLAFLAGQVNLASVAARARRRAELLERVGSLRSPSSRQHNTGAVGPVPLSPSGSGDNSMPLQRKRLMLGLALLAVAAVIGFVGWYKLAGEPLLNRQIPYLASAGMAVVILAALGGSLLVADQLRGDDYRIEELEAAVRTLADSLAPAVESPPRLRNRTGSGSGGSAGGGTQGSAGGGTQGSAGAGAAKKTAVRRSPRTTATE